jgi:hypothetical protein
MTTCERLYQMYQSFLADGVLTRGEQLLLAIFGFFGGCF